ncbi:MAG: hypothetical protein QM528_06595 [Phycisphaerales bacterium]|nr:hypothetical protein [Phycisphaerales bacterium]
MKKTLKKLGDVLVRTEIKKESLKSLSGASKVGCPNGCWDQNDCGSGCVCVLFACWAK